MAPGTDPQYSLREVDLWGWGDKESPLLIYLFLIMQNGGWGVSSPVFARSPTELSIWEELTETPSSLDYFNPFHPEALSLLTFKHKCQAH